LADQRSAIRRIGGDAEEFGLPDIWHQFGSDLLSSPAGDLATASGVMLGQQRVLRRLLTNPGDYIWQLDYGAGLAQFIGQSVDVARIQGVIRSQIFLESAVARSPEPQITVQASATGQVYVNVIYTDAPSGQPQVLSFSVGGT
jgi:phage baseplate assembly protein W